MCGHSRYRAQKHSVHKSDVGPLRPLKRISQNGNFHFIQRVMILLAYSFHYKISMKYVQNITLKMNWDIQMQTLKHTQLTTVNVNFWKHELIAYKKSSMFTFLKAHSAGRFILYCISYTLIKVELNPNKSPLNVEYLLSSLCCGENSFWWNSPINSSVFTPCGARRWATVLRRGSQQPHSQPHLKLRRKKMGKCT